MLVCIALLLEVGTAILQMLGSSINQEVLHIRPLAEVVVVAVGVVEGGVEVVAEEDDPVVGVGVGITTHSITLEAVGVGGVGWGARLILRPLTDKIDTDRCDSSTCACTCVCLKRERERERERERGFPLYLHLSFVPVCLLAWWIGGMDGNKGGLYLFFFFPTTYYCVVLYCTVSIHATHPYAAVALFLVSFLHLTKDCCINHVLFKYTTNTWPVCFVLVSLPTTMTMHSIFLSFFLCYTHVHAYKIKYTVCNVTTLHYANTLSGNSTGATRVQQYNPPATH